MADLGYAIATAAAHSAKAEWNHGIIKGNIFNKPFPTGAGYHKI